jgi:hypothetical protein
MDILKGILRNIPFGMKLQADLNQFQLSKLINHDFTLYLMEAMDLNRTNEFSHNENEMEISPSLPKHTANSRSPLPHLFPLVSKQKKKETENFHSYLVNGGHFNVSLFNPLYPQQDSLMKQKLFSKVLLPTILFSGMETFEKFYSQRVNIINNSPSTRKQLHWFPGFGQLVVNCRLNKKRNVEIIVNEIQFAVLYYFEHAVHQTLVISQLSKKLNLDLELTHLTVQSLLETTASTIPLLQLKKKSQPSELSENNIAQYEYQLNDREVFRHLDAASNNSALYSQGVESSFSPPSFLYTTTLDYTELMIQLLTRYDTDRKKSKSENEWKFQQMDAAIMRILKSQSISASSHTLRGGTNNQQHGNYSLDYQSLLEKVYQFSLVEKEKKYQSNKRNFYFTEEEFLERLLSLVQRGFIYQHKFGVIERDTYFSYFPDEKDLSSQDNIISSSLLPQTPTNFSYSSTYLQKQNRLAGNNNNNNYETFISSATSPSYSSLFPSPTREFSLQSFLQKDLFVSSLTTLAPEEVVHKFKNVLFCHPELNEELIISSGIQLSFPFFSNLVFHYLHVFVRQMNLLLISHCRQLNRQFPGTADVVPSLEVFSSVVDYLLTNSSEYLSSKLRWIHFKNCLPFSQKKQVLGLFREFIHEDERLNIPLPSSPTMAGTELENIATIWTKRFPLLSLDRIEMFALETENILLQGFYKYVLNSLLENQECLFNAPTDEFEEKDDEFAFSGSFEKFSANSTNNSFVISLSFFYKLFFEYLVGGVETTQFLSHQRKSFHSTSPSAAAQSHHNHHHSQLLSLESDSKEDLNYRSGAGSSRRGTPKSRGNTSLGVSFALSASQDSPSKRNLSLLPPFPKFVSSSPKKATKGTNAEETTATPTEPSKVKDYKNRMNAANYRTSLELITAIMNKETSLLHAERNDLSSLNQDITPGGSYDYEDNDFISSNEQKSSSGTFNCSESKLEEPQVKLEVEPSILSTSPDTASPLLSVAKYNIKIYLQDMLSVFNSKIEEFMNEDEIHQKSHPLKYEASTKLNLGNGIQFLEDSMNLILEEIHAVDNNLLHFWWMNSPHDAGNEIPTLNSLLRNGFLALKQNLSNPRTDDDISNLSKQKQCTSANECLTFFEKSNFHTNSLPTKDGVDLPQIQDNLFSLVTKCVEITNLPWAHCLDLLFKYNYEIMDLLDSFFNSNISPCFTYENEILPSSNENNNSWHCFHCQELTKPSQMIALSCGHFHCESCWKTFLLKECELFTKDFGTPFEFLSSRKCLRNETDSTCHCEVRIQPNFLFALFGSSPSTDSAGDNNNNEEGEEVQRGIRNLQSALIKGYLQDFQENQKKKSIGKMLPEKYLDLGNLELLSDERKNGTAADPGTTSEEPKDHFCQVCFDIQHSIFPIMSARCSETLATMEYPRNNANSKSNANSTTTSPSKQKPALILSPKSQSRSSLPSFPASPISSSSSFYLKRKHHSRETKISEIKAKLTDFDYSIIYAETSFQFTFLHKQLQFWKLLLNSTYFLDHLEDDEYCGNFSFYRKIFDWNLHYSFKDTLNQFEIQMNELISHFSQFQQQMINSSKNSSSTVNAASPRSGNPNPSSGNPTLVTAAISLAALDDPYSQQRYSSGGNLLVEYLPEVQFQQQFLNKLQFLTENLRNFHSKLFSSLQFHFKLSFYKTKCLPKEVYPSESQRLLGHPTTTTFGRSPFVPRLPRFSQNKNNNTKNRILELIQKKFFQPSSSLHLHSSSSTLPQDDSTLVTDATISSLQEKQLNTKNKLFKELINEYEDIVSYAILVNPLASYPQNHKNETIKDEMKEYFSKFDLLAVKMKHVINKLKEKKDFFDVNQLNSQSIFLLRSFNHHFPFYSTLFDSLNDCLNYCSSSQNSPSRSLQEFSLHYFVTIVELFSYEIYWLSLKEVIHQQTTFIDLSEEMTYKRTVVKSNDGKSSEEFNTKEGEGGEDEDDAENEMDAPTMMKNLFPVVDVLLRFLSQLLTVVSCSSPELLISAKMMIFQSFSNVLHRIRVWRILSESKNLGRTLLLNTSASWLLGLDGKGDGENLETNSNLTSQCFQTHRAIILLFQQFFQLFLSNKSQFLSLPTSSSNPAQQQQPPSFFTGAVSMIIDYLFDHPFYPLELTSSTLVKELVPTLSSSGGLFQVSSSQVSEVNQKKDFLLMEIFEYLWKEIHFLSGAAKQKGGTLSMIINYQEIFISSFHRLITVIRKRNLNQKYERSGSSSQSIYEKKEEEQDEDVGDKIHEKKEEGRFNEKKKKFSHGDFGSKDGDSGDGQDSNSNYYLAISLVQRLLSNYHEIFIFFLVSLKPSVNDVSSASPTFSSSSVSLEMINEILLELFSNNYFVFILRTILNSVLLLSDDIGEDENELLKQQLSFVKLLDEGMNKKNSIVLPHSYIFKNYHSVVMDFLFDFFSENTQLENTNSTNKELISSPNRKLSPLSSSSLFFHAKEELFIFRSLPTEFSVTTPTRTASLGKNSDTLTSSKFIYSSSQLQKKLKDLMISLNVVYSFWLFYFDICYSPNRQNQNNTKNNNTSTTSSGSSSNLSDEEKENSLFQFYTLFIEKKNYLFSFYVDAYLPQEQQIPSPNRKKTLSDYHSSSSSAYNYKSLFQNCLFIVQNTLELFHCQCSFLADSEKEKSGSLRSGSGLMNLYYHSIHSLNNSLLEEQGTPGRRGTRGRNEAHENIFNLPLLSETDNYKNNYHNRGLMKSNRQSKSDRKIGPYEMVTDYLSREVSHYEEEEDEEEEEEEEEEEGNEEQGDGEGEEGNEDHNGEEEGEEEGGHHMTQQEYDDHFAFFHRRFNDHEQRELSRHSMTAAPPTDHFYPPHFYYYDTNREENINNNNNNNNRHGLLFQENNMNPNWIDSEDEEENEEEEDHRRHFDNDEDDDNDDEDADEEDEEEEGDDDDDDDEDNDEDTEEFDEDDHDEDDEEEEEDSGEEEDDFLEDEEEEVADELIEDDTH